MCADKRNATFGQHTILAGKYRLIQGIGTGAHGEVFEAEFLEDHRKVAVKIFYRHLEQDILKFIFKELKVISSLSHPHILQVIAFGRGPCSGSLVHYLVTPLMEGKSVAEVLQQKKQFSIADSIEIILQMADALGYMHSHNFIHRDVKPQNILSDKELKNFVLADFGIVCQADTLQTRIAGTMEYCAPEQMENSQKADYRMDIYGLGTTLYELLTGTNPYRQIAKKQGEAAAIKCKYVSEFPLVSETNENIPYSLALIVKKMIANSPNDRYANMQQVTQELQLYTTLTDKETPTSRTEMPKLTGELNTIFDEARKLRQQKAWPEALVKYNTIIQNMPECAQAYYGCGMVYLQLKRYQDAIKNFTLALKYRPNSYSTYCQRSQAYLGVEDYHAALADLNQAISIISNRAEAFFYRASVHRLLAKHYLEQKQLDLFQNFQQKMKQDLERYQQLKASGGADGEQSQQLKSIGE